MDQSISSGSDVRLSGKVVVITGGSRGIGGATARLAGRQGASVVVGDVLEVDGRETTTEIESRGGRAHFCSTDVSKEADCQRLMASAIEQFGQIDVLIGCAGILQGAYTEVDELGSDTFDSVTDTNVRGMFLTVKHVVPHIKANGGGVIICLSSGAGVRGGSSSVAYGTSKAAVHGLSLVLQPRLAPHDIRVHAVCPGGITTPLKLKNVADGARHRGEPVDLALAETKLGTPGGVAKVLTWLASDDADYVRGTIFTR